MTSDTSSQHLSFFFIVEYSHFMNKLSDFDFGILGRYSCSVIYARGLWLSKQCGTSHSYLSTKILACYPLFYSQNFAVLARDNFCSKWCLALVTQVSRTRIRMSSNLSSGFHRDWCIVISPSRHKRNIKWSQHFRPIMSEFPVLFEIDVNISHVE